ncbi:hypothetical protein [Rhodobacter sp. TJ_12]|uniref:hypothetical protein n=1 Tax=Rhodobacter sp. TJ_12 TaxID=2029399 RepID=UPI001CBC8C56|nr:hypothetical protein [Rhodobacter sp. TJ_12]
MMTRPHPFTPALGCVLTLAVLGLAAPRPVAADEALYYLLSAQDIGCLQAHAEEYAPKGGQTRFITLAECGGAQATGGSLLDQVLNSAPDITASDASAEAPDTVVALTAADFDCLARLELPQEAALVAFYPESCDVEPR